MKKHAVLLHSWWILQANIAGIKWSCPKMGRRYGRSVSSLHLNFGSSILAAFFVGLINRECSMNKNRYIIDEKVPKWKYFDDFCQWRHYKVGPSTQWLFGTISAWGSKQSTAIGKTHTNLSSEFHQKVTKIFQHYPVNVVVPMHLSHYDIICSILSRSKIGKEMYIYDNADIILSEFMFSRWDSALRNQTEYNRLKNGGITKVCFRARNLSSKVGCAFAMAQSLMIS